MTTVSKESPQRVRSGALAQVLPSFRALFALYYNLTKPRMVYMNVIVAMAAFVFASHGGFDWHTFAAMAVGLAGVVASACAFNNYADRAMDAKMERTKQRALAAGQIAPAHALVFATALLVLGIYALHYANPYALGSALTGFIVYVFIYTPLKPRTPYALYAGAVAGAMPPVVGYAAAAHTVDTMALALFAILFLWQIPHFLAIARYRYDEYTSAGVPLLVARPESEAERRRARTIFYLSLVVLVVVCGLLILQRWII